MQEGFAQILQRLDNNSDGTITLDGAIAVRNLCSRLRGVF